MAGWVRPLLRALYARDEEADVHLFFVPDDYATGAEAEMARTTFPAATVYDPKTYLKVALGQRVAGLPAGVDAVLYLGGDLMHAARLHKRLGGVAATYKFSRPRYARTFSRAYAVDDANIRQLREWKTEPARIRLVGNLAIDGALLESRNPREAGYPQDGVLFMPGSRRHEVEHLIPFFFTAALRMRAEDAELPIAFGLSPFTSLDAVRRAIEAGGHPHVWAEKGTLRQESGRVYLASADGKHAFPVVRQALAAATCARLVVTIPGTKAIELAALGKPAIAITPLNAPEEVAINGPLTYLDRLPVFGRVLKRAVVVAVARRHRFHTQPNIDAGEELIYEMHGTLTPGRVARVALERCADAAWLTRVSQALGLLYTEHVGAADRMAADLIQLSESKQ